MKAISLLQPWASLVVTGHKRLETRSWRTNYRGPLLIHASARLSREARDLCEEPPFRDALEAIGVVYPFALPLGQIIGIANLVGMYRIVIPPDEPERSFGDYTYGRFAWRLVAPVVFASPIPCKGALGLWDVPEEVLAAVKAQQMAQEG